SMRLVRASTPILASIADHEVTNDFSGGAPAASDPRFGGPEPFINETPLYTNGIVAFHEWHPIDVETYGATGSPPTDGQRTLYRSRWYGSDAAIHVLDARSFRDAGLTPADPTNPADIGRFVAESFDPSRTMLGRVQVEELKADLLATKNAGIRWKFVVVPEPIQNLGVAAASDRFEGYAAERTEILSFIDDNDISNVVFVAADIH
ncbi:alkaline phosphatase D family protein, partial [Limnoraphis robusta CCNP1324]|uniref:alkaline phosphatase D family protein n=1 Tax=Limnoraphis robusta TaxID=1118279 RepID=UPI002B21131E